jgi:4-coumarate--CoA ligase
MSDFCVDAPPLVIPSNLTLVQFILDHHHPNRPLRPPLTPWFIEEATGRPVFYEEVRPNGSLYHERAQLACDCA